MARVQAVDEGFTGDKLRFDPAKLSVAAGTTLLVANVGGKPHTLTADDGSFDTGIVDPGAEGGRFAGKNASVTLNQAGHLQVPLRDPSGGHEGGGDGHRRGRGGRPGPGVGGAAGGRRWRGRLRLRAQGRLGGRRGHGHGSPTRARHPTPSPWTTSPLDTRHHRPRVQRRPHRPRRPGQLQLPLHHPPGPDARRAGGAGPRHRGPERHGGRPPPPAAAAAAAAEAAPAPGSARSSWPRP